MVQSHAHTKHVRVLDNFHPDPGPVTVVGAIPTSLFLDSGETVYKSDHEVPRFLCDIFKNVQCDTNANAKGKKRNVVLVMWAKHMEEETIRQLGLDWLESCFGLYDLRRFPAAPSSRESLGQSHMVTLPPHLGSQQEHVLGTWHTMATTTPAWKCSASRPARLSLHNSWKDLTNANKLPAVGDECHILS